MHVDDFVGVIPVGFLLIDAVQPDQVMRCRIHFRLFHDLNGSQFMVLGLLLIIINQVMDDMRMAVDVVPVPNSAILKTMVPFLRGIFLFKNQEKLVMPLGRNELE